MASIVRSTIITLRMIKVEHSLFALPFALLGALLAAGGWPETMTLVWILVAMVSARSAAMAFNRLTDRRYDALNPRTKRRALPSGLLSVGFVRVFIIASSMVFFFSAAMLNRLTFMLSPLALASILVYSYAKRFTAYSHLLLGWCLAMAPAGAWMAVRGAVDSPIPVWLGLGVMAWTAGFDILYACQDVDFDQRVGLKSVPQRFGIAGAVWISRCLHLITFLSFSDVALLAGMGVWGAMGIVLAGGMLIRQHTLVRPNDLSRLNQAFFTTNAYLSIVLFLSMGIDILGNR